MSKSDQLRALRERAVEAQQEVAKLTRAAKKPEPTVAPWLAPVGHCPSCDRRRAASIEKMKAYRARKKLS